MIQSSQTEESTDDTEGIEKKRRRGGMERMAFFIRPLFIIFLLCELCVICG